MALASLDVIVTVWVLLTRFQLASTALTVTVTGEPAVCVVGVPVLPLTVPGAAVSPGIKTCSLAAAATLTGVNAPVLSVRGDTFVSVAVTVQPVGVVVLKVTLNVCVPLTRAAFPGKVAFKSVEVMAIV